MRTAQLPVNARHASSCESVLQPGSCVHVLFCHAGFCGGSGGLSQLQGVQAAAGAVQTWGGALPAKGGTLPARGEGAGAARCSTGDGALVSICAQADNMPSATRMRAETGAERGMFEGGMWIIYLEMVAVLVLAALIVWWTMPRRKPLRPAENAKARPTDTGEER